MATMYTWSPIQYDVESDKDGNVLRTKSVPMGESVTASKLGVGDDDFQALIDAGVVRDYKVPDMPKGYAGSIVDHLRAQQELAGSLGLATSMGGSPFGPTTEEVLLSPAHKELREGLEDASEEEGSAPA